jgi:hypothetical protein
MKPAAFAAAVVLDIVAAAHLVRLVFHTRVVIGDWVVPMWVSAVGCVVAAVLSIFLFLEAKSKTS